MISWSILAQSKFHCKIGKVIDFPQTDLFVIVALGLTCARLNIKVPVIYQRKYRKVLSVIRVHTLKMIKSK